jgi:hypothetical protein
LGHGFEEDGTDYTDWRAAQKCNVLSSEKIREIREILPNPYQKIIP